MSGESRRPLSRRARLLVALPVLGAAVLVMNLGPEEGETAEAPAKHVVEAVAAAVGPFSECADCHSDLDEVFKSGRNTGLLFTHEEHFEVGSSDCAMCHPVNAHEPDRINKPTMTRCYMCHGPTQRALASGTCETCHPTDFPDRPGNHLLASWEEEHGERAKEDAFDCATCHEKPDFCSSCHGVPMPHPEGWDELPHAESFFEVGGAQGCVRCHQPTSVAQPRTDCDSCHHDGGDTVLPWKKAHPPVVKSEGAITCFDCHSPLTCSSCHVRGELDLTEDRAELERRAAAASSPSPSPSPEASPGEASPGGAPPPEAEQSKGDE